MQAPSGFASRLFVSGSLSFVAIGVLGGSYGVALPAFGRAFGLEPSGTGLILSAQATGAMLASLAAMAGVAALTPRVAAALMAAGSALIALGLSWPLTLTGGVVAGAGFGLIAAHVNSAFLSGFGARGAGMVGLVNAVSGIGLVLGPLLAIWLGSTALAFAVITLAALALIPLFPPGNTAQAPRGLPHLWQPRMAVLLLNLVSVALEASLSGLGVINLIATGWTEPAAASLASAFFAAFLLSRLSLYWLAQVFPAERLFLAGTLGTAAACALAAAGWAGTGYVLAGATIGIAFPSFFVWGSRVLGPDPRMGAAMVLSGFAGVALGPLVFGGLIALYGLPALFPAIAITAAGLGLVIALVLAPTRRLLAREGR